MTEALRRLREEIDAAFDDQKKLGGSKTRVTSKPCKITPKWGQVTALLASVGLSTAKNPTSAPLKHISGGRVFKPVTEMPMKEKRVLLRKVMKGWRRKAHETMVVTRASIRARKRRYSRLIRMVFKAWRDRGEYQVWIKIAATSVARKAECRELGIVWNRWTTAQRSIVGMRLLYVKRRRRIVYKAVEAWMQFLRQREESRRLKQVARRYLLRCWWRRLETGLSALRQLDEEVGRFAERRIVHLIGRCFVKWVEYVEQCKRRQFAACWSQRRALGDAFDGWREAHTRCRHLRHTLQLANRRRRRRVLRAVMDCWNSHAAAAQMQRYALDIALQTQQRRQAFMQLKENMRYDQEREAKFQCWKIRRSIWVWLDRSYQHRMLRLKAVFLKENHERLVLRAAVWRPWRRKFQRSIALRRLKSRSRENRLRQTWIEFVAAIHHQKEHHTKVKTIVGEHQSRSLRRSIVLWNLHVRDVRHHKKLVAKSTAFRSRKLLKKAMLCWTIAHYNASKKKDLAAVATTYLARKMVQHWARWAYWSRRELARKIAAVSERKRRHRLRCCITRWKQGVGERHKALCYAALMAWKAGLSVQRRERQLLNLRRVVHLRLHWQKWIVLTKYARRQRSIVQRIHQLYEQRLMRCTLVTVWLFKTRRYAHGSSVIKTFARRYVMNNLFSRWRKRQLHLSAVKRAVEFHRDKLKTRYLRWWFTRTIDFNRIAIVHSRRHIFISTWHCWKRCVMWRWRRRAAEYQFQQYLKRRTVLSLRSLATKAIQRRTQVFEADAWHEAVLMQNILSKWLAAAKHAERCRGLAYRLSWRTVGRRAFLKWHDGWMETQQLLKAEHFYSWVLISRSWNALLRITKRRQVALAMWNHTMASIRLGHVMMQWKNNLEVRHGQHALADAMGRMQQQRVVEKFFSAWLLLATARRQAVNRQQRESLQWMHTCFVQWKLWRISRRWHRCQDRALLYRVFSKGLRRHAIQQQAARELYVCSARNILLRSLARWRVEWWLVRSQKKMATEVKRKAFLHWMAFVAACRQKRRWEHYVQQLHRSQIRSKATTSRDKRSGAIFRDTRALQAQLKRNRVLMTHVLHAWYLVAHSNRRHSRSRPQSRKKCRSGNQRRALEFWAERVLRTRFETWRELVLHPTCTDLEFDASVDYPEL